MFSKDRKGGPAQPIPFVAEHTGLKEAKEADDRVKKFSRRPHFTSNTRTDVHAACPASPISPQTTHRRKANGNNQIKDLPKTRTTFGIEFGTQRTEKVIVHTLVARVNQRTDSHTTTPPSLSASRMRSYDGSGARRVC